MDHLLVEVEREQELLEWERAEMEMEALRESRLDEERAMAAAGTPVEPESDPFDFTRDLPFPENTLNDEDIPF